MKFISKSNFRHFKLFSSYSTQLRMRIAECMRPISHGRPFQWHHSARLSTVNIWSEMSLLAAGKELTAVFILLVLSVVVYVRGKWEIKFRWTSAAHLIRLLMTSCFKLTNFIGLNRNGEAVFISRFYSHEIITFVSIKLNEKCYQSIVINNFLFSTIISKLKRNSDFFLRKEMIRISHVESYNFFIMQGIRAIF